MAPSFPDFDSLPHVESMPDGCAWGIFDDKSSGKKDVFGCLNRLTPDIVLAAKSEIMEGTSVSLNWQIGALKTPGANRKGLEHTVINFMDTPLAFHGYDDEVAFNTQCSSQWDGLCHYYHQESQRGYNGTKPSVQDLTQDFGAEDVAKLFPTLNHWHERGGLVGRGVLIDFQNYAEANGVEFDAFNNYRITVAEIEACAKAQGVTFKPGDVFIIRTGFTETLGAASAERQAELMGINKAAGVDPSTEAAKWFWNQGFSAVASDNIAFETKMGDGRLLVLHQYFLSLFGLNIGELWDLKALAEKCKRTGRYSFFFTSIPLNVPGAVGSPPNALAVF